MPKRALVAGIHDCTNWNNASPISAPNPVLVRCVHYVLRHPPERCFRVRRGYPAAEYQGHISGDRWERQGPPVAIPGWRCEEPQHLMKGVLAFKSSMSEGRDTDA